MGSRSICVGSGDLEWPWKAAHEGNFFNIKYRLPQDNQFRQSNTDGEEMYF